MTTSRPAIAGRSVGVRSKLATSSTTAASARLSRLKGPSLPSCTLPPSPWWASRIAEPARYYRTNIAGTLSLLDACRARGIDAIVFSSTCAIYGVPERVPIGEDAPQRPANPYGASKLAAERALGDHEQAYGIRHVTLRYFNAAGADPEKEIGECRAVETHLVPLTLDAALGVGPPLRIMGTDYPTPDGTAIRDYVQVTDLAEAHVAALRHLLDGGPSMRLNLGTGRGQSVREVVACVEKVTGRRVPSETASRRLGDSA